MVGITFVCVMLLIDIYFNNNITWLKISILTFTFLVFIAYEIMINYFFKKAMNTKELEDEKVIKSINGDEPPTLKSYNEKYLWFLSLVLVDVVMVVAMISKHINSNHFVLIIAALAVFYVISLIARPYFGVIHHRK
jgi:hypothetical protein